MFGVRWGLQLNLVQQQVTRNKPEIILHSLYYLGAQGRDEELVVLGTEQIHVEKRQEQGSGSEEMPLPNSRHSSHRL